VLVLDLVHQAFVVLERHHLFSFSCGEVPFEHAFFTPLSAHDAVQVAQRCQAKIDQPEFIRALRVKHIVEQHRFGAPQKAGRDPFGQQWIPPEQLGNYGKICLHLAILQ